jgi:DeoR/GlpR family transcriptional regulator of sugar metabolism
MLTQERQRLISELILNSGNARVGELSEKFGVSEMTIWRDLKVLENQGLIERVRGGALSKAVREDGKNSLEPVFESKQELYSEQKRQIARYAAEKFVDDGDIVVLEGGTTVVNMVPFMRRSRLTVLTNALPILVMGTQYLPGVTLMGCGGILREASRTFVGPQAERFFSEFRAQKLFVSATGLTLEHGLTDPNPLEISVKRAMHKCANRTILLLDSSKFGLQSLAPILSFSEIDTLITDSGAPKAILRSLESSGMKICIVDGS